MKILFLTLLMLGSCYFMGFLLVSNSGKHSSSVRFFRAHMGYAYFLVAFYSSYMLFEDSLWAVSAIFSSMIAIGVFQIWKKYKKTNKDHEIAATIKPGRSIQLYIVALASAVFLLSAWPYLSNGLGNYWHSGNPDIEDGLNGRDAYLENLILDTKRFQPEKIIGDKTEVDFEKKVNAMTSKRYTENFYRAWFAGDGTRFQYSNLAFWSLVLQEKNGMDVVIIHAIFNLILMALAVFYLALLAFQLSVPWAAMTAFSSVSASFYLGTFWAGHIGSMMYGSLAPVLLCFMLTTEGRDQWQAILPWLMLCMVALSFTYPEALIVAMSYWVSYRIYISVPARRKAQKIKAYFYSGCWPKVLLILSMLVVVLLFAYVLWLFTGDYRLRQAGQYRSWGLVHDLGITTVFFGLVPAPLDLSDRNVYHVLTTLGAIFSVACFMCMLIYKGAQARFVHFFALVWIFGLLVFYLCIRDSYYIYKYLYINQFVFIVALCAFIEASKNTIIYCVGGGLLAVNLMSDIVAGNRIRAMPYNGQGDDYFKLTHLSHDVLKKTFINLKKGGESTAVRQTLKKYGIKTELDPKIAEYFIVHKGGDQDVVEEQLGESIFSSNLLEVRKTPEKNFLIVRTFFEPEFYRADQLLHSIHFRWVGYIKNENVGIYIIRPDHDSDHSLPFLRICAEKGPSAASLLTIKISTGDNKQLTKFPLNGVSCIWLPSAEVKDALQPLILRTGAIGKKLQVPEDRILLYRIFSIAWVEKPYDDQALLLLNAQDDLIHNNGNIIAKFGNGWWSPEVDENKHFRWASDGAEIVIPKIPKDIKKIKISLDVEVGPSHGTKPFDLIVTDEKGKRIFRASLKSYHESVELPVTHAGVYRIYTGSEHKQIPGDPRVLDFRIFHVETRGC